MGKDQDSEQTMKQDAKAWLALSKQYRILAEVALSMGTKCAFEDIATQFRRTSQNNLACADGD